MPQLVRPGSHQPRACAQSKVACSARQPFGENARFVREVSCPHELWSALKLTLEAYRELPQN